MHCTDNGLHYQDKSGYLQFLDILTTDRPWSGFYSRVSNGIRRFIKLSKSEILKQIPKISNTLVKVFQSSSFFRVFRFLIRCPTKNPLTFGRTCQMVIFAPSNRVLVDAFMKNLPPKSPHFEKKTVKNPPSYRRFPMKYIWNFFQTGLENLSQNDKYNVKSSRTLSYNIENNTKISFIAHELTRDGVSSEIEIHFN